MTTKTMPTNFASIVAANVTALRKERGLTVAAAAQLAGVSPRTWAYFEKPCQSRIQGASIGSNIDRICAAFEVPLERLLAIPGRREKETAHAAKSVRRFIRKSR